MMTKKRNRGSALLLSLVVLVVLLGLAGAFLGVASYYHRSALNDLQSELAFTLAESGIDAAINELNARVDYASDGLGVVDEPMGGGSFAVSVEPPFTGPGRYVLRSTGEHGDAFRFVVAVVAPQGSEIGRSGPGGFGAAVFGDILVNLRMNASVDSYDSREGDYDAKRVNRLRNTFYAGSKSHVKSNNNVRVGPNAKVFGDVTAGPSGDPSLLANAHVSGAVTRATTSEKLAPVEIPPLKDLGNRVVSRAQPLTVSGEDARYASLRIDDGATLTIKGPATVVLDHFTAGPNTKIVVDGKNGPVTIYGTGPFQIDPTTEWVNAHKNPSHLALRIATDNILNPGLPVEVDGKGRFYGTIYAPNASLNLDSSMELFGAVSGKMVVVESSVEIHYDEALGPVSTSPEFRLVSWEEVPAEKDKKKKPKK